MAPMATAKYKRWALTPVTAGLNQVVSIQFSSLFEIMRHELAAVGGNRRGIFAYADPGGFVADDPGTDDGIALIECGQVGARLIDKTLRAVGSVGADVAPHARK